MTLGRRLKVNAIAGALIGCTFTGALFEVEDPLLLMTAAGGAVIFTAVVSHLLSRPLLRTIDELREVVQSWSEGKLSTQAPLKSPAELAAFAKALRSLGESQAARLSALQHEGNVLSNLIEALDEGVVAVDSRRQITLINAAARELLQLHRPTPLDSDLLPRSATLRNALDLALAGKPTDPMETMIGAKAISLTARPLPRGAGAVIAFFDLTPVKRLETVRRDFVVNVSHELRTPLTVITGFAETLLQEDVDTKLRQQFATTIGQHAERMRRIVDDLLDLSRLESGRWEPRIERVDLLQVASEVASAERTERADPEVVLEVDIPDGVSAEADATAVRQIFANLLDNSLRHTERGTISLFAREEISGTWLGVADTGSGIAPHHLDRIFERFYRADPGRDRKAGGTGLGLAIVKHLVEAHGGKLTAESVPSKGTTISAFFPRQPVAV